MSYSLATKYGRLETKHLAGDYIREIIRRSDTRPYKEIKCYVRLQIDKTLKINLQKSIVHDVHQNVCLSNTRNK